MNGIKRTLRAYKAFFAWKGEQAKALPTKWERLKARLKLFLVTPWCLLLRFFKRNPSIIVTFAISAALVSSSVWVFYLVALIVGLDSPLGKSMVGIGSAVWTWWLIGPGSPFIGVCLALAISLEALWRKIRRKP